MASGLAVYASSCQLPEHHATLASGRWLDLAGWVKPLGRGKRFQTINANREDL